MGFTVRNWLTLLWRLTSLKICRQQAGDQREDNVVLVHRPADLTPRKNQCPSSKAGKKPMIEQKAVRQGDIPSYSQETLSFLLYSDLQLIEWGSPTLGKITCFIQSIDLSVKIKGVTSARCWLNILWYHFTIYTFLYILIPYNFIYQLYLSTVYLN